MLELPRGTVFNRRIPKQKFYENLTVTAELKRIFVEQINVIYWRNKIAPSTVNIAAGETVKEIEVIEIRLNQPGLDKRVLQLIDREIPYHILFLLVYEEQVQAWIGYKEQSQGGTAAFKPGTYYHTEWQAVDELSLRLDGLNMDSVYEGFIRQIAGERLEDNTGYCPAPIKLRQQKNWRNYNMEKMRFESQDLTAGNIDKIAAMFPGVITEGKVNFDLLRSLLGDEVYGDEAYEFTWVGKRAAIAEAGRPIHKTLRPCMEESKNWDTTENLYIEGDNLDVLKLLQESYLGKVKMIYIDPPYNTGNDFVYRDNFTRDKDEYDEEAGVYDEDGDRLFRNTESNGRFHSDWCSMMYPRLVLARNLLRDDGVIFISIDDGEAHNLRKICDEVYGTSCFVCSAIWRSSDNSNNDAKQFSYDHNLTLIYSKQPLWQPQKSSDESKRTHFKNPDNDPRGPWFDGNPLNSPNYRENLVYDLISPSGKVIKPPKNGWRWSQETMQEKISTGEIRFTEDETSIRRRTYLCDMEGLPPSSLWTDLEQTGHNRQAKYELLKLMPEDVFDTPKPVKLIKFIINLVMDCQDAIVMDFFSGSGTTAHAVMQCNAEDGGTRKFILVQLPENLDESLAKAANDKKQVLKNAIALCDKNGVPHLLSEVAKERIRRAGEKIKADNAGKEGIDDLDIGFRVLKLDSTNMRDVYYAAGEYTQDLLSMMEDNIKDDRTDMDLLYACLLDWGLPLSMPHTQEKIDGFTVHTYNDGDLVACFDKHISDAVVKEIAKRQPLRAVFRDSSFSSSPEKINVEEIFKLLAPNTSVRVI